jgi:hypothetical protein
MKAVHLASMIFAVASATAIAQEQAEMIDVEIVAPQQANIVALEGIQVEGHVSYSRY